MLDVALDADLQSSRLEQVGGFIWAVRDDGKQNWIIVHDTDKLEAETRARKSILFDSAQVVFGWSRWWWVISDDYCQPQVNITQRAKRKNPNLTETEGWSSAGNQNGSNKPEGSRGQKNQASTSCYHLQRWKIFHHRDENFQSTGMSGVGLAPTALSPFEWVIPKPIHRQR